MTEQQTKPKKKSTIIFEGQDTPTASKDRHYVSNDELLEALKERKEQVKEAEVNGEPKPPVSNFIGECFLKIAQQFAKRRNFMGAKYEMIKDDMILDAVENCLKYVDNFDPEISSNPFSYFTQGCYYAFLGRIKTEDKNKYIKFKSMLETGAVSDEGNVDNESAQGVMENKESNNEFMEDFVRQYEDKHEIGKTRKSRKKQKNGIKKFFADQNDAEDV